MASDPDQPRPRACARDPWVDAFVRTWGAEARATAARIAGPAHADDIAQEFMLSVWRRGSEEVHRVLREVDDPRRWVRREVTGRALNCRRKQMSLTEKLRRGWSRKMGRPVEVDDVRKLIPMPSAMTDDEAAQTRLLEAVDDLPAEEREAFVYRYLSRAFDGDEEATLDELAAHLKISRATLVRRLQRARDAVVRALCHEVTREP